MCILCTNGSARSCAMDYKQWEAIYNAGLEAVVQKLCELTAENKALRERLKQLEEQQAKNSRNSSKPPSSDGLKKPNQTSSEKRQRERNQKKGGKRKPGAQKGHKGNSLNPVEDPNHIEIHSVQTCQECGRSLKEHEAVDYEARQVFDIPPIQIEVTEHRAEIKECPHCDTINTAEFPEEVNAPTQYGSRVKSIATYMKVYQLIPYKRSAEFFQDIFSLPLSEGTLVNIIKDCSKRLHPVTEQIRKALVQEAVGNFDESGCRVEGKRIWIHVTSTPELTYYELHDKRGREAMDEIGILPDFKGRSIHDFFQSYYQYDCDHGLCNAHLLRELIFLYEVQDQKWADQLIDCLLDMKDAVEKAKETNAPNCGKQSDKLKTRYDEIVQAGLDANLFPDKKEPPKRGRPKRTKAQNLLIRLRDYKKDILAFVDDFTVPFDNNLSERDLRMIKIQQKISGTFRSATGGDDFCRIRGYISTIRKQAMNVIHSICRVFTGNPFVPCSTDP